MTDYNPAHYMAGAWPTTADAVIYCTRCESPNATVYAIAPDAKVDDRQLDRIIAATQQHHRDHHTTPQCAATIDAPGGQRRCDDVPDHWGVHTHLRTWWPNDRDITGDTHCTANPRCRQYTGHDGPCQLHPEPRSTEEPPW